MICDACKNKKHFKCENVTTCPCQHRVTKTFEDGTITPLSERNTLLDAPELTPLDLLESLVVEKDPTTKESTVK